MTIDGLPSFPEPLLGRLLEHVAAFVPPAGGAELVPVSSSVTLLWEGG